MASSVERVPGESARSARALSTPSVRVRPGARCLRRSWDRVAALTRDGCACRIDARWWDEFRATVVHAHVPSVGWWPVGSDAWRFDHRMVMRAQQCRGGERRSAAGMPGRLVVGFALLVGRATAGEQHPPSRSESACRIAGGTSRWVRPTSRISEPPPRTTGVRSASQHRRRRSPALIDCPLVSSPACSARSRRSASRMTTTILGRSPATPGARVVR